MLLHVLSMAVQKIISVRCTLLPEILDRTDRVGAKSSIFDLFSLVATEP